MVGFLAKRTLWAFVTLFLYLTVVFVFTQIWVPHDFATQFSFGGGDQAVRESLGLNRPLVVRWADYMWALARLDLGESFSGGRVVDVIRATAPVTIFVFAVGAVLAYVTGEMLGRVGAWQRRRVAGGALSVLGVVSATIFPPFLVFVLIQWLHEPLLDFRNVIGLPVDSLEVWRDAAVEPSEVLLLMAVALFGAVLAGLAVRAYAHRRRLRWLGVVALPGCILAAVGGVALSGVGWNALDLLYRVDYTTTVGEGSPILVLIGVVLISFGQVMFIMRVGIGDEKSADYVLTARAKGLTEAAVRDVHVARNALAPTLAGSFLALPTILAGMVIIELELQVQGLSSAFFSAVEFLDIPLMMGVLVMLGLMGIVFRIVTDVAIAILDPRLRTARL